jgi:hypothetical protein
MSVGFGLRSPEVLGVLSMGQGRHSSYRFWGVLLIAVAIQGITPDSEDVASPRAILLLSANFSDHSFQNEDEWPDDVCEVARFQSIRLAPGPKGHLRTSELSAFEIHEPLHSCQAPERPSLGSLDASSLRLIYSLCRVRC